MPFDMRLRNSTCTEFAFVPPKFVVRFAPDAVAVVPPSTSGFARKKFAGRPATTPFARKAELPMNPEVEFVEAKPNGFGFMAARNPRFVEFVNCVLVYFDASAAFALERPWKKARNVGRGDVPGMPV